MAHVAGAVPIRVLTPGGISAVNGSTGFTYSAGTSATISSLGTTSGGTGGGTEVRITGTHLASTTAVSSD